MRDEGFVVRLRDANPVPAVKRPAADEALLGRLLAEPRTPVRQLRLRRAALLFAAVAVLIGGTAAGLQRFAVQYFGADDSEPTPAAIIAELRWLNQTAGAQFGPVDAESFVRLAAFDTAEGRVTIYVAPSRGGDGYCVAEAIGSTLGGGSCGPTANPEKTIPYSSSWNSDFGDVHMVYGRLMTGVAAIDVRFQDGRIQHASVRAPWWIYVVGGDETEPGHAPIELVARAADGAVVGTEDLNPYAFMNREAIEAAIPESDGSPGQDAIRATLVLLGAYGAQIAPQVELDRVNLVRTVQASRGSFDVYTAPWGDGGLCFGYANSGRNIEHNTHGCPSGDVQPDQPRTFDSDEILANGSPAGYAEVDGPPPAGAARVTVRFENGTSAEADVSTPSFFIFWFEPKQLVPGRLLQELVAWDAQGRVIDRLELTPPVSSRNPFRR
jgi:hypothetical protein